MTSKKRGRPSAYSPDQVRKAVDFLEDEGEEISAASVADVLHRLYEIPTTIKAQSLQAEIDRQLEIRERERTAALTAALPAETRTAIQEIGQDMARSLTAHVARQYGGLRAAAAARIVEMDEDIRSHRDRIRELERQIETRDSRIADLELDCEAKEARHIACEAEIADLVAQNARLRMTIDLQADLRHLVHEALGAARAAEGGGEVASPGE